jgi:hypothetical protein
MTKEEFLKEHQNNEELIKELDEIIGVLKTCDDQIPYFAIHMKQLGQDLYSYHEDTVITKRHKDLLSILVDIGIVDKFPSRHKDETSTYRIKTSQKFSKTLLEQLNNWKNEQQQKSQPNIVENYTNSNVIKGSAIQESQLQFESENAKQSNTAHTNQPNANEPNEIMKFILKFWWAFLIPLLIVLIEHKWIAKLFNGE